jgi:hypothetical protein
MLLNHIIITMDHQGSAHFNLFSLLFLMADFTSKAKLFLTQKIHIPNCKLQSETKPKKLMSFFPTPIVSNILMKTTQHSASNVKTHIEFIVP